MSSDCSFVLLPLLLLFFFLLGGGLLQKVHRDLLSFATKLSFIRSLRGEERDICKQPKNDREKRSLPGRLTVTRNKQNQLITVKPLTSDAAADAQTETDEVLLQLVWDHGPVQSLLWDSFDLVRARVDREWSVCPLRHQCISAELQQKMETWQRST